MIVDTGLLSIVALTGRKQHGKDTVCDYLVGKGFYKMAFADPIKRALSTIFSLSLPELEHLKTCKVDIVEGVSCTMRRSMQTLGTEWGRELIDDKLWLTLLKRDLIRQHVLTGQTKFAISGLRFLNEEALIRSLGGCVLRVHRPGYGVVTEADTHHSETEMAEISPDYVLVNDSSLDDLYRRVDEVGTLMKFL